MTPWDRLRRTLGLVFLSVAAGFTGLGLTVLEPRLRGGKFLIYWLVPALGAAAALVCALIDLRVSQRRYQLERNELLKKISPSPHPAGGSR